MVGKVFVSSLLVGWLTCSGFAQDHSIKLIQTRYSKKAVRLVLKNMGKKVGSGTSLALLTLLEKKTNAGNALKFSLSKKSIRYVSVGDELYFSGSYKDKNVQNEFQPTEKYIAPMHYAVVVGIKNDTTLIIAHQNVNENDLKRSCVAISTLLAEDIHRYENINVYGLVPKKSKKHPEKLLVKDGPVYEINPFTDKKNQYLVYSNFNR